MQENFSGLVWKLAGKRVIVLAPGFDSFYAKIVSPSNNDMLRMVNVRTEESGEILKAQFSWLRDPRTWAPLN